MGIEQSDNVGIAFALVIGAGAATGLGACVVFFPSLVKLASRKTLAGGLGLSAGVMTYVSFVEILGKAETAFQDAGINEDDSTLYMTLTFFGGVIFMILLNFVVHSLLGAHHHHHQAGSTSNTRQSRNAGDSDDASDQSSVQPCACLDEDPGHTLDKVKDMAHQMEHHEPEPKGNDKNDDEDDKNDNSDVYLNDGDEDAEDEKIQDEEKVQDDDDDDDEELSPVDEAQKKDLMRTSLNTALAIGLHNFPEGLATFVAALDDPGVGAVLAIAIAIHNIPEGLCVAMPIYYATGNRWKAFGWAMLSGIAEPIAGLCGWLILSQSFSDQLYGVLFGMVSGMMVIISVRELLPTAHRYDPHDTVVTNSFIAGMGIMALSLVLFLL